MRRRSFLKLASCAALIAATAASKAQERAASTLVFKVSSAGRRNYLVPSIHAGFSEADAPPTSLHRLIAERSALYLEADVRNVDAMSRLLDKYASTSDNHLRETLSANDYKSMVRRLALIGVPEANVARMRPWMIGSAMPIVRLPLTSASAATAPRPEFGTEMTLIPVAEHAGIPIRDLEGLEAEFIALSDQKPGEDVRILEDWIAMVEDGRALKYQESVIRGWRDGDVDQVASALERLDQLGTPYAQYYVHRVIRSRNEKFAADISRVCNSEDNAVILVGIEHFAGFDGLPKRLVGEGLSVDRFALS